MSGSNLPKAILSPPSSQEEKTGEGTSLSTTLRATRYYEAVRNNAINSLQEMHQNRLKSLRKELDYLKESEWKYETIDKYIGQ